MRLRSICLACLCLVWGAAADSERIAEYCADILDDNTYRPMLIKDIDEPIREWNYPDSVSCREYPCETRWATESKVFFPYDINCPEDVYSLTSPRRHSGVGGITRVCFDCGFFDMPVELKRIKKVKLYGSRDGNNSKWNSDEKVPLKLRNARETLKNFYGQLFRGYWTAAWDPYHETQVNPMEVDFYARLVGECNDTIPALEYCVNGSKNAELHLTNYYDVLPQIFFTDGETIGCSGEMRVEKTYEMDFAKYGKRKLVHSIEQDTCHAKTVVANEIHLPVPKYISAKALKGIPAKKLYGTSVPVISKNTLTCNFKTFEKDVVFYARIGGKCNKDELQEKKRINLDETGQTADVRVRDGSEVYWKECGEDCKAFGKCIKMKDLLR